MANSESDIEAALAYAFRTGDEEAVRDILIAEGYEWARRSSHWKHRAEMLQAECERWREMAEKKYKDDTCQK